MIGDPFDGRLENGRVYGAARSIPKQASAWCWRCSKTRSTGAKSSSRIWSSAPSKKSAVAAPLFAHGRGRTLGQLVVADPTMCAPIYTIKARRSSSAPANRSCPRRRQGVATIFLISVVITSPTMQNTTRTTWGARHPIESDQPKRGQPKLMAGSWRRVRPHPFVKPSSNDCYLRVPARRLAWLPVRLRPSGRRSRPDFRHDFSPARGLRRPDVRSEKSLPCWRSRNEGRCEEDRRLEGAFREPRRVAVAHHQRLGMPPPICDAVPCGRCPPPRQSPPCASGLHRLTGLASPQRQDMANHNPASTEMHGLCWVVGAFRLCEAKTYKRVARYHRRVPIRTFGEVSFARLRRGPASHQRPPACNALLPPAGLGPSRKILVILRPSRMFHVANERPSRLTSKTRERENAFPIQRERVAWR